MSHGTAVNHNPAAVMATTWRRGGSAVYVLAATNYGEAESPPSDRVSILVGG
jgi:hypothetical protein